MRRVVVSVVLAACAAPTRTPTVNVASPTATPPSSTAVATLTRPPKLTPPAGIESKPTLVGWAPAAGTVAVACTSAQGLGSADVDVDAVPGATRARLVRNVQKCGAKAGARLRVRLASTAPGKVSPAEVVVRDGMDEKITECVAHAMTTVPLAPIDEPDGGVTPRTFECWVAVY